MTKIFEKDEKQLENRGSFQRKFGIKIAKAGIVAIPKILLFIKKLKLNYADFFFIYLILSRKYDRSWPYFSLNKITRELGICQDTLHKAKNRLMRKDFLRISRQKENPRGNGRNTYDLTGLFVALEMLVDANADKLFKTSNWNQEDYIDYVFLKETEMEKLSEKQRENDV